MIERISGNLESFCGHDGSLSGSSENNSLKSTVPECLGDPQDKGFSRRLGLAMRKRRDQIFEIGERFVQLKEAPLDRHRQKPQWKLIIIKEAPSASSAPSSSNPLYGEKIIPETHREDKARLFGSYTGGTTEHGANGALGAEGETFVFEDDLEERAAIQRELQKDGGIQNGKTQAE